MKCPKCEKEVGNLFCAKCRAEIEHRPTNYSKPNLFPLLYWDFEEKCYRIGCTVIKCPANKKGICQSPSFEFPMRLFHSFDGDNIIHQVCG